MIRPLSTAERAYRNAVQRGADPDRAAVISSAVDGMLTFHREYPPQHRKLLTPRQRRRLQHKHLRADVVAVTNETGPLPKHEGPHR